MKISKTVFHSSFCGTMALKRNSRVSPSTVASRTPLPSASFQPASASSARAASRSNGSGSRSFGQLGDATWCGPLMTTDLPRWMLSARRLRLQAMVMARRTRTSRKIGWFIFQPMNPYWVLSTQFSSILPW